MSKVDLQLKQAFTDLQQKSVDTSQKVSLTNMQIDNFRKSKQRSIITERELSTLQSETKMYESVGRMFILTPNSEVFQNINKRKQVVDERIANLENTKAYLERNLKEAVDNLRDMVQQRK